MSNDTFALTDFKPDQRVELHPATDLWMRGVRYGTVVKVGRKKVTIKPDRLPNGVAVYPRDIARVVEAAVA